MIGITLPGSNEDELIANCVAHGLAATCHALSSWKQLRSGVAQRPQTITPART